MASCHCGAGLLAEQPCLPGRFLVGKEKGPLAFVCVGPGCPTEFLGLQCGEWVLLDCGDDASALDGRQPRITDRLFFSTKVARGFLSGWERMAAGLGASQL